jgi:diaminopimelate decarboxylase
VTEPPALLAEAAERWGTPIWVTDLDRAAVSLAVVQAALPGSLIAYAVKANADPQLLRRLVAQGAGCEVVTGVELELARRAGCPPEWIVMNGVGRTDAELRDGLAAGVLVNAESLDDLAALLRLATAVARPRIGLRLNPALDAATHRHLATGAASAKFGIALADLPGALATLREAGLPLAALGAHIGSDIAGADAHLALLERLAAAEATAAAAGLAPERIDIGGGFATTDPAVLRAVGEAAGARFGRHRLICEPGRSLVADAGWLVTRVVRVQPRIEAGLVYLVADAGMTDLIRPVLYGAEHPVSLVKAGEALAPAARVDLAGPVCEAGDVLATDVGRWLDPGALARCGRGALLAIGRAGAYGAVMSMTYNGRPRAAEVVVDGGVPRLSRRRETVEDLLARDV